MNRRSTATSLVLACIVASGAACRSAETPTAPAPTASTSRRLLVVTHTTGFRHPSISTAESVLAAIGRESRLFTVAFCRDAQDVARLLTPDGLSGVDAVFFANTTGNLGIADLPAFLGWVREGHAFIGAHSAADTYHDAPEYLDMLGAEFDGHGDESRVEIRVEDRTHPAGAPLASPLVIFDEIYTFRPNPRGRADIVLSLDRHPPDGRPAAGQPGDYPLAWSRGYGSGRVFYTALGHRDDVWTDTRFRQHILGAIRWALDGQVR